MRFFNKLLAKIDLALIKRSRITHAERQAKRADTEAKRADTEAKRAHTEAKRADQLSEITKTLLKAKEELSAMRQVVTRNLPDKVLYKNFVEVNDYNTKTNFAARVDSAEYDEKVAKLICGLDGDSVETTLQILSRLRSMFRNPSQPLDFYSDEEQQLLRDLKQKFSQRIFQVKEGLYCYKNYFLPVKHFEASVFYYKHGLDYVKDLVKVENKDIVDAGAFIGDSALILSPYTNKKVYAFEANSRNYSYLEETIALNSLDNVVPVASALGRAKGSLNISLDRAGSSCLPERWRNAPQEVVPVDTLDSFVKKHGLDVGLIKVDIEGTEQDFLHGAKQTICEQKPVLLLSIYHTPDDFVSIKPLIEDWKLGYKFTIFKPVDGSICLETLLIAEVVD